MKILITGGCGYKGSVLIPLLLSKGHEIINVDTQWFGNYLKKIQPEKVIYLTNELDLRANWELNESIEIK